MKELMERASLEAMPRRRLQLLAKKAGIRANQKNAVLVELLLEQQQHHHQQTDHALQQQESDSKPQSPELPENTLQQEEEEKGEEVEKPEQHDAEEPEERDGDKLEDEPEQREEKEEAADEGVKEVSQEAAEEGVKEVSQEVTKEASASPSPAHAEPHNDTSIPPNENESTQNTIRQEIVDELASRLQQARPDSATIDNTTDDNEHVTKTLSSTNGERNIPGNVVSKNIEQYAEEKAKRHMKLSSTPRLATTTNSKPDEAAKTPSRQKAFDLKQSLSRGVSWKMKKGPLPTFSETDAATSSLSMFSPNRQEQRAKLFKGHNRIPGTEKRRFNLLATGRANAQKQINEHRMRVTKEATDANKTS